MTIAKKGPLFRLPKDPADAYIERLEQENDELLNRVQELECELTDTRKRLQHREFDVMTFCSIVGVEIEEDLETRLRQLAGKA